MAGVTLSDRNRSTGSSLGDTAAFIVLSIQRQRCKENTLLIGLPRFGLARPFVARVGEQHIQPSAQGIADGINALVRGHLYERLAKHCAF
ncbi:MAG: hypothetical protein ABIQ19_08670, partial [Sphingomonas sp.]